MLDKLGNYRIFEPILEREPGPVYRGLDSSKNLEVAVQFLHPHLTESEEIRKACAKEAAPLASLSHPNISRFYEFIIEGERCVYISELLKGRALEEDIAERTGPHGFVAAFKLISAVLSALDFAHGQGVIHGGIRPASIMIAEAGNERVVKLLNFGIAMGLHGGKGPTYIGARMKSYCYLAPEQLEEGGKIDARADIYSAAVVLYELTTGEAPYCFDSLEKFSQNMSLRMLPPTPRSINPGLSRDLEDVILKGMSHDRGERFQSAKAFLGALEALGGGNTIDAGDLPDGVDAPEGGPRGLPTAPPKKGDGRKGETSTIVSPPVASGSPVVDKSFHDAVETIRQRERDDAGPGLPGAPSIRPGPSRETGASETGLKGPSSESPVSPKVTAPPVEEPPAAAADREMDEKRFPASLVVLLAIAVAAAILIILHFKSPDEEEAVNAAQDETVVTAEQEAESAPEAAPVPEAPAPEGMVLVPGGTFSVGNDKVEGSPVHQATLSPFFVEMVQHRGNVSWYEADEACQGKGLRLPTEHEWEMAAQMGLIEIGPNADWVQDWYGGDNYGTDSGEDPTGPSRIDCAEDPGDWGAVRESIGVDERCCKVLRGFVWDGCGDRVHCRSFWGPDHAYRNRAFRCVKAKESGK
ncbi:protein kinase [Thermodesulfobacteriota bacterium]